MESVCLTTATRWAARKDRSAKTDNVPSILALESLALSTLFVVMVSVQRRALV